MPILKNQRHELFAQGIASGKSAAQAYIDAGYSENGAAQSAERLLRNADLATRILEFQRKTEQVAVIDRARVLARLDILSRKAEKLKQYTAAIRAEELLGKATRLFDEQPADLAARATGITYRWAQPDEFAEEPAAEPAEVAEPAEIKIKIDVGQVQ